MHERSSSTFGRAVLKSAAFNSLKHWSGRFIQPHVVGGEERYREWGSFIESVKGTLLSLTIEQGTEPVDTDVYANIAQVGSPMDSIFLKLLLPILAQAPSCRKLP